MYDSELYAPNVFSPTSVAGNDIFYLRGNEKVEEVIDFTYLIGGEIRFLKTTTSYLMTKNMDGMDFSMILKEYREYMYSWQFIKDVLMKHLNWLVMLQYLDKVIVDCNRGVIISYNVIDSTFNT